MSNMLFNDSQKKAIEHFKGPALVLAGPGSGKTAVITQRTYNLIEKYKKEMLNIKDNFSEKLNIKKTILYIILCINV